MIHHNRYIIKNNQIYDSGTALDFNDETKEWDCLSLTSNEDIVEELNRLNDNVEALDKRVKYI